MKMWGSLLKNSGNFQTTVDGDFPGGSVVKNLPANAGATGDAGVIASWGTSPGGKKWESTPVFLPGEFHGQKSLADPSP